MGKRAGAEPAAGVINLTAAFFALQKNTPQNNVIVGDDPAQIRFMEQQLGIPSEVVDRVTDDMLVGQAGRLYRVYATHRIDLSPEMRNKTGFWEARAIVKGSSEIAALVKHAATLIAFPEKKLTRELINLVADKLTKGRIYDVRGTIWEAVWLLSGDVLPPQRWRDPWDAPTLWLDAAMNVNQRLHVLYHRMVAYAWIVTRGKEEAKKLGAKPSDVQWLHEKKLDINRVYRTIYLLSRWKQGRMLPYVCAMQIAVVWQ